MCKGECMQDYAREVTAPGRLCRRLFRMGPTGASRLAEFIFVCLGEIDKESLMAGLGAHGTKAEDQ